jgi:hypothetical protein
MVVVFMPPGMVRQIAPAGAVLLVGRADAVAVAVAVAPGDAIPACTVPHAASVSVRTGRTRKSFAMRATSFLLCRRHCHRSEQPSEVARMGKLADTGV